MTLTLSTPFTSHSYGEVYRQGKTYYYAQLIHGGSSEIEAESKEQLLKEAKEFINAKQCKTL